MPDGVSPGRSGRDRDRFAIAEGVDVELRERGPGPVPGIEAGQLCTQHRGLDLGEARVDAGFDDVVAVPHAVVAESPRPLGQLVVVGGDRAAVAERPEVLGRVEGEGAGAADRTDAPAVTSGPVGLGGVLDDEQAGRRGEVRDRLHVGRLAPQVHGDDRRGCVP